MKEKVVLHIMTHAMVDTHGRSGFRHKVIGSH